MFCPTDEAISCTGSYVLTQADVDSASITNVATATALPPAVGGNDTISSEDSDWVMWSIHPALTLGEQPQRTYVVVMGHNRHGDWELLC